MSKIADRIWIWVTVFLALCVLILLSMHLGSPTANGADMFTVNEVFLHGRMLCFVDTDPETGTKTIVAPIWEQNPDKKDEYFWQSIDVFTVKNDGEISHFTQS